MHIKGLAMIAALSAFYISPAYAEVLARDGFESGDFSYTENGFRWGSKTKVTIVETNPKTGRYSARYFFEGNPDLSADSWSELRFKLPYPMQEIWIRYDLYVPNNYYHRRGEGSSNNKGFFMLWHGEYHGTPQMTYINWWPTSGKSYISNGWKTGDGGSSHHYFNDTDWTSDTNLRRIAIDPDLHNGRWVEVILHVKAADPGVNNGATEIWLDRKVIWSITNASNYYQNNDNNQNYYTDGYFLGWANSGFDQDTIFYMDNVVFATSRSDVFDSNPANPPGNIQIE